MADLNGSAELARSMHEADARLRGVCSAVDPADLLAPHAVAVIEMAASTQRLLTGVRTLAVLRVLESKVWRDEGHRSPQHWLAATLGVTVGQAARIIATAERVRYQPEVAQALRDGALSDDEAEAVTGAIEADPDGAAAHLWAATGGTHGNPAATTPDDAPGAGEDAGPDTGPGDGGAGAGAGSRGDEGPGGGPGPDGGRGDEGPGDSGPGSDGGGPDGGAPGAGGPGRGGAGGQGDGGARRRRASIDELRKRRARAKAKADADEAARQARLHRERSASRGPTPEGGYSMRMHITKEAGLRFDRAWDAAMAEIRAERKAAGLEPLLYGQLAADALLRIADRSLQGSTPGPSASPLPGPKTQALLLVDVACLRRGHREGDELCEIPGVGPVPVRLAQHLLGDSILSVVIRDGVDVLSVTSLNKTIPTSLRTALWARSQGTCEVPGCTTRTGLEIDHDHERQFAGRTELENLSVKCWQHHQDKTHHGWRLIGPPGRRAWVHLDDLPADPAQQHVPLDDLEHLLPPPRTATAPPAAGGTGPPPDGPSVIGTAAPAAPPGGEDQLHLLDA